MQKEIKNLIFFIKLFPRNPPSRKIIYTHILNLNLIKIILTTAIIIIKSILIALLRMLIVRECHEKSVMNALKL